MKENSLIVVGTGIKCLAQITPESKACIKSADKVLYLLNDSLIEEWINGINHNCESLENFYRGHQPRLKVYQEITNHVIKTLEKTEKLCLVFDGHPIVYAQSALNAVIEADNRGFKTKILPGISAENCLYADLRIDPSDFGCHSYDATDFVIRPRNIDNTCHLILWQVGSIGELNTNCREINLTAIKVLIDVLSNYYPSNHVVVIYEAAQYEGFEPRKESIALSEIVRAKFSSFSTLYIPPIRQARLDKTFLQKLNIEISQLKKQ